MWNWKRSCPHLGSGCMGYQYIKCIHVHTGQAVSWGGGSVQYSVDVNPIPKKWNGKESSVSNKTHEHYQLELFANVIIVVVSVCPPCPKSLFNV